ncbi:tyrosine-type recombinase/integrase [Paenibacillus aceti]|uniref:Tyrosine recombinase XerD n=1 Tax=Paenibacillus aceti TaxID=1820010 RepID=A0ABQ1W7A3_9BACL|nr:tyrosine-type recombinase/integrase [Paenibacillus aceti]GGG15717.1 tyrosine recombinase XerD [Paenibacillus aceti]
MSIDPRKGKKRIDFKPRPSAKKNEPIPLDLAFNLFYSAKRAEKVRERTLADYRSYWRYFCEWLDEYHPDIDDVSYINTELLRGYLDYMSFEHTRYKDDPYRKKDDRKLSAATVKSRLRALQTMCKFWSTEGIIADNPTEKIKPPRVDETDKNIFTDDQLSALLNAPDTSTYVGFRDITLMMLLADTGLRINEALRLVTSHFDFAARCIRLPASLNKNRKPRIVPMSAPVVREIIRLIEETQSYFDTDCIFVSVYGDPLKADHFRKQLIKYAKIAGIDTETTKVTPHRFRDYFITNYLVNGGDLFTLQRIVAHADIKTTQGYVRVNEEVMRDSHSQYSQLANLKVSKKVRRK